MRGRVIADRYRLVRPLGEGAMGSVWLAEHLALGSEVAVKLIRARAAHNANARARFDREARIAARIRSTHVVQVLDHGTTADDQSFIVMEYLTGESLGERLEARGRLRPAEMAQVVRQICLALTKAHEEGLVHRDLKPENIYIALADEDEEIVKILDFGVAKATDAITGVGMARTRTGALLGTPYYMSPEQAEGKKTVDHRSDLWAVGIVVYECLTGELPFDGKSLGVILSAIVDGPIAPPSTIAPTNANAEIDAWLLRALTRDPEARFQSARELSEAFSEAAASFGRPARQSSSPPPPSEGEGLPQPPSPFGVDEITDHGTIIVGDVPPEGGSLELGPGQTLRMRRPETAAADDADAPPPAGPAPVVIQAPMSTADDRTDSEVDGEAATERLHAVRHLSQRPPAKALDDEGAQQPVDSQLPSPSDLPRKPLPWLTFALVVVGLIALIVAFRLL